MAIGVMLFAVFQKDMASIKLYLESTDTIISRQPLWLQGIQIMLIGDFTGYWIHRALHNGWLRRFHAIHHSPVSLDWLSSVRLHPINDLLMRAPQVMVILGVGYSPISIVSYVPFLTLYAIMLHANLNWTYGKISLVFASPVFHRWHHTAQDENLNKNFAGLFPVFGMVFGTYYLPRGKAPERFGVQSANVPDGFWGQILYPFRKSDTRTLL